MSKPRREELLQKVVRLAKLPPGKGTFGYLSRDQLIQLIVYLEHCTDELERLRKEVSENAKTGT